MFAVGVMDEPVSAWDWHKQQNNATTEASVKIARSLSAASTVLLKNADGILPLPSGKKIAVIGFGTTGAVVHGGGSGAVTPSYIVSPLEGIQAAAGEGSTVVFDDGTTISTAAAAAKNAVSETAHAHAVDNACTHASRIPAINEDCVLGNAPEDTAGMHCHATASSVARSGINLPVPSRDVYPYLYPYCIFYPC